MLNICDTSRILSQILKNKNKKTQTTQKIQKIQRKLSLVNKCDGCRKRWSLDATDGGMEIFCRLGWLQKTMTQRTSHAGSSF